MICTGDAPMIRGQIPSELLFNLASPTLQLSSLPLKQSRSKGNASGETPLANDLSSRLQRSQEVLEAEAKDCFGLPSSAVHTEEERSVHFAIAASIYR